MPSTTTTARPEVEADGHLVTVRIVRCQNGGALSCVEYDPDITRDDSCSHCHVIDSL